MFKKCLTGICVIFFSLFICMLFMFYFILIFGSVKAFEIIPREAWFSWISLGFVTGICFEPFRTIVLDFIEMAGRRLPARHDSTYPEQ